jgi:hypothetical protein
MRARNLALILAVFAAAAAATAFVVSQLPREGQVSPLAAAPAPTAPDEVSPPLTPVATAADGVVEVHVTAGPEPLAAAEVRLYAAPEGAAPWRRAGEGRTDRAGVAALPARPGAYLVAARAPGLVPGSPSPREAGLGRGLVPGSPSPREAGLGRGLAPGLAEVVRGTGVGPTRVTIVLAPPAALEGRAAVSGAGPLADARVRVVPLTSRWPGFASPAAPPEEIAEARTDGAGAFRVVGLAPGSFAVLVEAPGYHPVLVPRVAVPGGALALQVEPLGAVAGTVLRADGSPAAGATLRAASADHGGTATAGADGAFRLALPAGSYALLATLGDRAGAAQGPVAVAAGAATRAGALRLGPAAAVEGEVRRPGGAPAEGADVVLLVHGTREVAARAGVGEGGRFSLGGLAPGAYDLRASAAGASPALLEGVTVAAGQRFATRVALLGTGAVAGTVRDGAGRPLAGILVRALDRGDGLPARGPAETRTDFEGRFLLEGLELGRAEIVARQDALQLGASRAVRVGEGRAATVDLVLPEAGVLAGRVAEGGRAPPPGTTVLAVAMQAGPGTIQVARVAADARGNFEVPLPAGEYRVHAAPGAAARTDLRVAPAFARVEPGRTTQLALAVAAAQREEGVDLLVLEPGGSPSPGATVTLARPDDGRVALATTAGEDGRVALDARMGMAGRPVTIRARNGGRSGSVTLPLPATGTVAVRLSPGGAVEGVVRGARGSSPDLLRPAKRGWGGGSSPDLLRPAKRGWGGGFTLEVSSQPGADGWRTLDVHRFAGDRFELGDLPAEPLRLVVRSDDGRRGAAEIRVGPGETRTVEIALR